MGPLKWDGGDTSQTNQNIGILFRIEIIRNVGSPSSKFAQGISFEPLNRRSSSASTLQSHD